MSVGGFRLSGGSARRLWLVQHSRESFIATIDWRRIDQSPAWQELGTAVVTCSVLAILVDAFPASWSDTQGAPAPW
jgi:hypothetical protein